MIHAILLNPTVDVIYNIDNFHIGGTFKVENMMRLPVGKAISFAMGARELDDALGLNVLALIGQEDIPSYSRFLKQKNINHKFIKIEGNTRSNKTILDTQNNTTTHIREQGFTVGSECEDKIKTLIEHQVKNEDICVFGGSIPPGLGDNIYYKLIKTAREQNATCALDTSGAPLIHGIECEPNIIKPNLVELSQILKDNSLKHLTFSNFIEDAQKLVKRAKNLLNKGLKVILISLGEKGAILLNRDSAYFGHVQLEREIIDTVGAGDSFLAGFIVPYSQGMTLKNCFKRAIATGAASCLKMGPGILRKEDMDDLLHSVKTTKIY